MYIFKKKEKTMIWYDEGVYYGSVRRGEEDEGIWTGDMEESWWQRRIMER